MFPGPVCSRGDLHALRSQDLADRLDRTTLAALLIDESEDQRRRGSSSPAKKTAASFKIALASRSSRFSRRNRRTSSLALLVTPSRWPASTCAWRTQRRSDSAPNPSRADTVAQAAVKFGYSSR